MPVDPTTYKFLHFLGMITLLLGLGAALAGEAKRSLRIASIFQGLGAVLLLVSGFGLQAKLKHAFDPWLLGKLGIWLVLAGFVVVAKRRLLPPAAAWSLVVVLATIATWLGLSHSLMMR